MEGTTGVEEFGGKGRNPRGMECLRRQLNFIPRAVAQPCIFNLFSLHIRFPSSLLTEGFIFLVNNHQSPFVLVFRYASISSMSPGQSVTRSVVVSG